MKALTSVARLKPNPRRRDHSALADVPADLERADTTLAELLRENAELKGMLRELQVFRTLAYKDAVTGLWNRRYFDERLSEEMSRVNRDPRRHFSILIVDLNDLKLVNDRHGHAAGDKALKWVGEFLLSHLRGHDVTCRIGGDEFAVLLPDLGADECARLLSRLRAALSNHTPEIGNSVGLSFGAASYPESGTSPSDLLRTADDAMYADKRRQKDI